MDSQSQYNNVDPAGRIRWENFLNPDVVRPTIAMISIYLAAFEILKDTLVDRVKGFYEFVHQYKHDDYAMEMHYSADVMILNKSPLYASLSWLESMEAIDKDDLASFEGVKSCRNKLAHELPSILYFGDNASQF